MDRIREMTPLQKGVISGWSNEYFELNTLQSGITRQFEPDL